MSHDICQCYVFSQHLDITLAIASFSILATFAFEVVVRSACSVPGDENGFRELL